MSEQDWEGVAGKFANHRTVGPHRAWCKCGEWCYPNSHCPCCMEAEGYEVRWSHPDNPLMTRVEWEASIDYKAAQDVRDKEWPSTKAIVDAALNIKEDS